MASESCDWGITVTDCPAYDHLDPQMQKQVVNMATNYLWRWTGKVYGLCEETVRPCSNDCTGQFSTFWDGYLNSGPAVTAHCGKCREECGCNSAPSLVLPGPISSVSEVVISGQILVPAAYRVDNHKWLVRVDGQHWPMCQDLSEPSGKNIGFGEGGFGKTPFGGAGPKTWEVTYKRGVPVPDGGKLAAETLACEFAKLLGSDNSCQLPKRFQQINRQGVTMTVLEDLASAVTEGHTGIWPIDAWVSSVMHSPVRAIVRSPDIPSPGFRKQTWP